MYRVARRRDRQKKQHFSTVLVADRLSANTNPPNARQAKGAGVTSGESAFWKSDLKCH